MPSCMVLFLTDNQKRPYLGSAQGMVAAHVLLILHIRSSQFWTIKITLVCKCKKTLCWCCFIQIIHGDNGLWLPRIFTGTSLLSFWGLMDQLGWFSWESMSLTVTHKWWTSDLALGSNVHSCNSHYFLARNWTVNSTKSGIAIHWAHSNLGSFFSFVFIHSFSLLSVFILEIILLLRCGFRKLVNVDKCWQFWSWVKFSAIN